MAFPVLKTSAFTAAIADNSAQGDHLEGMNGAATLAPTETGANIFTPGKCGLNYELFELAGLPFFEPPRDSLFEPRLAPLHYDRADGGAVILSHPETAYARVSGRITFRVEEPYYLHQRVELTLHRRFCPPEVKNIFYCLFASYMFHPRNPHLYLKAGRSAPDLSGWVGMTKPFHRAPNLVLHDLPGGRELSAEEHLSLAKSQPKRESPDAFIEKQAPFFPGPWLDFYYGLLDGGQAFIMMFKQPEMVRLGYSPNSGNPQAPLWNPAWDYVLYLEDARIDTLYSWDLCLAVKPYQGRRDVVREYERYLIKHS
jgi:hypothetical protein